MVLGLSSLLYFDACKVGDPSRHIWCNINSCQGLPSQANLQVVRSFGPFGDDYLSFKSLKAIMPGEELLWQYVVDDHPQSPEKKRLSDDGNPDQAPKRLKQQHDHEEKQAEPDEVGESCLK